MYNVVDGVYNVVDDEYNVVDGIYYVVDGQWSTWSNWTQCSLTCGRGNRVRHRACDSPAPAFGGLNCSGESVDMDDCLLKKCAGRPMYQENV